MAIIPRHRGHFVQPGTMVLFPMVGPSVAEHEGTLAAGELVLQEEYPALFEIFGTAFNDIEDDAATEFRMPSQPEGDWTGFEWRIRF